MKNLLDHHLKEARRAPACGQHTPGLTKKVGLMAVSGNSAVDIRRHASVTKLSECGTPVQGTKLEATWLSFMLSITVTYPLSIFVI